MVAEAAKPIPTRRLDYAPTAYAIPKVDLAFDLKDPIVRVTSVLTVEPRKAGTFVVFLWRG